MPQLSMAATRGDNVVFREMRVKPEAKGEAVQKLMAAGYTFEGKHRTRDVYLMKSKSMTSTNYVLIHPTNNVEAGQAQGVVVQDVKGELEALWRRKEVDVFDHDGIVGELGLHLPAYRKKATGQFIYLIDPAIADIFFAIDFATEQGRVRG